MVVRQVHLNALPRRGRLWTEPIAYGNQEMFGPLDLLCLAENCDKGVESEVGGGGHQKLISATSICSVIKCKETVEQQTE